MLGGNCTQTGSHCILDEVYRRMNQSKCSIVLHVFYTDGGHTSIKRYQVCGQCEQLLMVCWAAGLIHLFLV